MFEGDADLDIISEMEERVGCALDEHDTAVCEAARQKLDAGIGDRLLTEGRAEGRAKEMLQPEGYIACLYAAFMMRLGARIGCDHRKYFIQKLPGLPGHVGYRLPISDDGFRAPGKIQFDTALANYVDGEPRDIRAPTCFSCGMNAKDRGIEALMKCSRCASNSLTSYYCNKDCQAQNWPEHKVICRPPRSNGRFAILNV